MRIGTQHSDKDDVLTVMSSLGVKNICSGEISPSLDEKWSVEGLTQLRERVEKHGITLDMVPLPLSSAYISAAEMGAIMLGKSPQRDREIEQIQQMIRNCAKAGHPDAQVQHEHPGRGAHRTHAGPRRMHLQHVELR